MSQEKRTVLAVLLSIGILVGYTVFFAPKPVPQPVTPPAPATQSERAVTPSPSLEPAPAPSPTSTPTFPEAPEARLSQRSQVAEMEWSTQGGDLMAWRLNQYHETVDKDSPRINLVRNPEMLKHLRLSLSGDNIAFPAMPRYTVEDEGPDHLVLRWQSEVLELRVTYRWQPTLPQVDVEVEWTNRSAVTLAANVGLSWQDITIPPAPSNFLKRLAGPQNLRQPVGFWDGKRHAVNEDTSLSYQGKVYWAGIEERYFLSALVAVGEAATAVLSKEGEVLSAQLTYKGKSLAPGETAVHQFRAYLGPKEREALVAAGNRLEESIDYGWFSWAAVPILWLLKAFYTVLHNWGLAIIGLTLLIKLLLLPITRKSMKSMKAMQALQPELARLREKYKNERERLNTEMMQLFRTHKVNPAGGCLPMLLQMPIYIALYKVLYSAIELYHAPFFAYYKDLAAPDPYFIAPVLLGIFMVLQQKLTPASNMDPAQQKMMMFMPIMFSAFMLFLPAGLVIYIFVNTFTSVIQQWMMRHELTWMGLLKGQWKMENRK